MRVKSILDTSTSAIYLQVLIVVFMTWAIPISVFFTSIIGWQYFAGRRTVPVGKCYVQYMEDAVFNCILQVHTPQHISSFHISYHTRKPIWRKGNRAPTAVRVWRPLAKKSTAKTIRDFLLMVSNRGRITYRFKDIFAHRGWKSDFRLLYCRPIAEERLAIST